MFRFNTQLNIPEDSSDKILELANRDHLAQTQREKSVSLLSYFVRSHRENENYFFGFVTGFPRVFFFSSVVFISCFFFAFAMYGSTPCLIAGLLFFL
jgi:hypothetical protein